MEVQRSPSGKECVVEMRTELDMFSTKKHFLLERTKYNYSYLDTGQAFFKT